MCVGPLNGPDEKKVSVTSSSVDFVLWFVASLFTPDATGPFARKSHMNFNKTPIKFNRSWFLHIFDVLGKSGECRFKSTGLFLLIF